MKRQIAVFFLADNRILRTKKIIRHCTLIYASGTSIPELAVQRFPLQRSIMRRNRKATAVLCLFSLCYRVRPIVTNRMRLLRRGVRRAFLQDTIILRHDCETDRTGAATSGWP